MLRPTGGVVTGRIASSIWCATVAMATTRWTSPCSPSRSCTPRSASRLRPSTSMHASCWTRVLSPRRRSR
ncbi:unnamed protein product, partial [Ixodes pacificus]